jgi:tyrosine-protein phosphatase SIW14
MNRISLRTRFALSLLIFLVPYDMRAADPATAPGVPNFHQVDVNLFRGAQPTAAGFKSLANLGVKTVIDLREGREHADMERKIVEAAGMHYVQVPMRGLAAPNDEQIGTVFKLLSDSSSWPAFVHCKRGADRTGTVIACYRISHDHWKNDKALAEAKIHGMSRIEWAMQHYILSFTIPEGHADIALPAGGGHP